MSSENPDFSKMSVTFPDRFFVKFFSEDSSLVRDIRKDLIGANMTILPRNYLSRVLFFTTLSILFALVTGIILFIYTKNIILAISTSFLIPGGVFFLVYSYPSMSQSSIGKRIEEELPFVTIHMAAIASSDLEPTKIFRLIANSSEYPTIKIEMRKVVNQIEIYGYNLTTALVNVSRELKNEKLAELFSGIAINISSGGSLKNYLEKKAENLLTDYRLERQQSRSLAETMMDVYISLLVTAPLIFLIVIIIMSTTGFKLGISTPLLGILTTIMIAVINTIFLFMIHLKQPRT